VLAHVPDSVKLAFSGVLCGEWLPRSNFELVYRGSHDGFTARDFHQKCDDKGATLVFIAGQSAGLPVCVFGGYAATAWEGPVAGRPAASPESFLFSVTRPGSASLVKLPVVARGPNGREVLYFGAGCGPVFGSCPAIDVREKNWSQTKLFDTCSCNLKTGGTFGNPLGLAEKTFTGGQKFALLELEVYVVC
jgi:hypothetical protein